MAERKTSHTESRGGSGVPSPQGGLSSQAPAQACRQSALGSLKDKRFLPVETPATRGELENETSCDATWGDTEPITELPAREAGSHHRIQEPRGTPRACPGLLLLGPLPPLHPKASCLHHGPLSSDKETRFCTSRKEVGQKHWFLPGGEASVEPGVAGTVSYNWGP